MKPLVWITGAGGLIGNYLVRTAPSCAPNLRVVGLTRAQLDLTHCASVRAEFQRQPPQILIHCAAMSRSQECQGNPVLARKINSEVPAQLAGMALKIPFIFFSTDLVFDGRKGNYAETDAVNPISVYAETKVIAEEIVGRHPRHLIIRTAINGGVSPTGDRGFNEQLRLAWKRGELTTLFTDEFRCPIPAMVTARAVWEVVVKNQIGMFHLGGAEKLSRYEIGKILADRCPELKPRMIPASLKQFHGAPRTPDVSMNCTKAQAVLSFPLPKFSEWLTDNPQEPI